MAVDNLEIEAKFNVDKELFLDAKQKIKEKAVFLKTSKQVDEYYTPAHRNFLDLEYPIEWLSIRERSGKNILNYKHLNVQGDNIVTHTDEFEVDVGNQENLKKVFSFLDFKKLVVVEKEREIFIYDEFEVVFDTVKDLGCFVEIEALKNFDSVEKTRKKIFELAKSLGIDKSRFERCGYPLLLIKKKGILKNM